MLKQKSMYGQLGVYVCTYVFTYVFTRTWQCVCVYIQTETERERERERGVCIDKRTPIEPIELGHHGIHFP